MFKQTTPHPAKTSNPTLLFFSLICGLLLFTPAFGQQSNQQEALPSLSSLVDKLQGGGYVIYLRHAATDQNTNDIDLDFSRCETQRILSAEGREQARQIGQAFQQLSIPVGKVISSPFCRCKETAQLAFQHYEVDRDLHFAIDVDPAERERLAKALVKMLSTALAPRTNTVIVAHTANLKEAAGIWPKPEGVAYIFEPQDDGRFKQVAEKVLATDWVELSEKITGRP